MLLLLITGDKDVRPSPTLIEGLEKLSYAAVGKEHRYYLLAGDLRITLEILQHADS